MEEKLWLEGMNVELYEECEIFNFDKQEATLQDSSFESCEARFLFLLVVDIHSRLVSRGVERGLIEGFIVGSDFIASSVCR